MCCVFTVLAFLGPRFIIVFWWIARPERWDHAFSTALWPVLGLVFMPWTTLAYVVAEPRGISSVEWVVIVLAALVDVFSLVGGAYGNRGRRPGYATSS